MFNRPMLKLGIGIVVVLLIAGGLWLGVLK